MHVSARHPIASVELPDGDMPVPGTPFLLLRDSYVLKTGYDALDPAKEGSKVLLSNATIILLSLIGQSEHRVQPFPLGEASHLRTSTPAGPLLVFFVGFLNFQRSRERTILKTVNSVSESFRTEGINLVPVVHRLDYGLNLTVSEIVDSGARANWRLTPALKRAIREEPITGTSTVGFKGEQRWRRLMATRQRYNSRGVRKL